MFWDKIANFYDFFEKVYNGKVYKNLGIEVCKNIESNDYVLECACGTGAISKDVAKKCKKLTATDYSHKMLKRAKKKCKKFENVEFYESNIMHLDFNDNTFDKVVAGNVIHLLDEPIKALKELERVCKVGGKMIIPTYINMEKKGKTSIFVRSIDKAGASFKQQCSLETYQTFFKDAGYTNTTFYVVEGKMPCAIAIVTKSN